MRFFVLSSVLYLLVNCRGQKSELPPIHPNLNMDVQKKFTPQRPNPFFADDRGMRPLVPGTVSLGNLKVNDVLMYGKDSTDNYTKKIPYDVSLSFIKRGQDRYSIFCTPCHGGTGASNGIMIKRGMLLPPSFHSERIVDMPVGQLYESIIKGVRGNMPAYNAAIPLQDRWAIVAYVKALQHSQKASLSDIPQDIAVEKGWLK
jgi:hypothetical protein